MKTTSNFYRSSASVLVAAFVTAGSLAVQASAVSPAQSTDTSTKSAATCVRVASLQGTSEGAISAKQTAMQSDFSSRLTKITTDEQQVDQKVATFRANLTNTFDTKVAKLETEKNLTADQKAAIETYKANMLTAESTREKAVDAARATYHSELKTAVNSRQNALTDAVTTFESSVHGAFTTAASACNSDGQTAITTLRDSVKSARTALKTSYSDTKVGTTISQDAATRKASIQAADQTFTQAAQGYAQALAGALGSSTSDTVAQ